MNEQVNRLVEKVTAKLRDLPSSKRYLIGVCGIPGSGKTTLGRTVVTRVNAETAASPLPANAVFVGLDGFHLTRAQLDAMPDPAEAHRRRGAAFTFDGEGFVSLVRRVRDAPVSLPPLDNKSSTSASTDILAPSFDHALKDPVADDVRIPASARCVVFEGNYLGLTTEPWRTGGELLDEIWFLQVDEAVARQRLAARHVAAGIVATHEQGLARADDNDLPNGRVITEGRWKVDETVISKDDGTF